MTIDSEDLQECGVSAEHSDRLAAVAGTAKQIIEQHTGLQPTHSYHGQTFVNMSFPGADDTCIGFEAYLDSVVLYVQTRGNMVNAASSRRVHDALDLRNMPWDAINRYLQNLDRGFRL